MNESAYRGRVAVITGASRGLGAGIAERLLEQGLSVGLCARGACPLAGRPGVHAAQLDVRDEAAVQNFAEQVAEQLGPVDLWVNNAGVLEPVAFARDLSSAALMEHLAINVGGVLSGSKAFVRHLRDAERSGVLVNISSGAALKGYAAWTAYCAGKAAVDRLTECVQLEEAEHGLRAYSVAPGVIDTAMQSTIRSLDASQFPAIEKFRDLKRREAYNTPKFVADKLLSIAFDPASRPESVVVRLPNEYD